MIPTGLLIAFIALGVVLVGGICVLCVLKSKDKKRKKDKEKNEEGEK